MSKIEQTVVQIEAENSTSALQDLLYTIKDTFKLIKKHLVIFVLIIALFSAATLGYSIYCYEDLYESTATFSIIPLVSGDSRSGVSVYIFNYNFSFAKQMSSTFPYIIESENLLDVIRNDNGGHINGSIEATPVNNTNIFKVSVKSSVADDAEKIMDSFIKCFPKVSEHIMSDVRIVTVYRSEPPTKPISSRSHVRHTLYGTAMGLAVNFVLFFILSLRRETIRSKNEIKTKLNSRYICEIPYVPLKRNSSNKNSMIKIGAKSPEFSESVRVMKKRVKSYMSPEDKVIGIMSALNGEGKTTIAFNLALSFASSEDKTLVIDMELGKRDFQKHLLKKSYKPVGVTDFCADKVSLDKLVYNYKPNMDIIFAGSESTKYISSKLEEIISHYKNGYDRIIIDMPACDDTPDAATIANLCDAVLFTVKYDSTSIGDLKSALQYVSYSSAKFIGVVMNFCNKGSGGYGYYGRYRKYGYHYRSGYGHDKYNSYSSYFSEGTPEK